MTSVVFMGTPQFAAPILTAVIDAGYDLLAVVTQPDRRAGRKRQLAASPVKQVALEHNIKVLQPEKLSGSAAMEEIIAMQPDFIITAAYGQFLPEKLLQSAQVAAINVHGSLLPRYRGGAPVQYAIMNGDQQTGVTIMYMVKAMDAGDIIAQEPIPIGPNDDTGTIFARMSDVGATLLLQTLPRLIKGQVTPVPQNESQVVFSPTIKPEQEQLTLDMTASQVDWHVRALRPQPGAYFAHMNGKRTKFWRVTPLSEPTTAPSGTVTVRTKHQLVLAAAGGTQYEVNELQPAGKPRMEITAYLNGGGQQIKEGMQVITDAD